jgi:hypothetical protein
MVGPLGRGCSHPHTPRLPAPSRPASAARALTTVEPALLAARSSVFARAHADDRHRDNRKDSSARWPYLEDSSLFDDKVVLVAGSLDAETVGQTSAENSLALGNGHQRSAMRTMSQQLGRSTWVQIC